MFLSLSLQSDLRSEQIPTGISSLAKQLWNVGQQKSKRNLMMSVGKMQTIFPRELLSLTATATIQLEENQKKFWTSR